MVCYRRHGHNEGDDPSYTQPLMYALIEAKRSVRKLYTESLVRRGDISLEEAEQALDDFSARLQAALDETRAEAEAEAVTSGRAPVLPAYVVPDLWIPPARDRGGCHRAVPAGRRGAHGARGLRHAPQAGPPVRAAGQGGGRRRDRLGPGRGAGHRLAPAGGDQRPAHRPGHPPGHLLPAPRRPGRPRHRRRARAPGRPRGRPVHHPRLAAVRVRLRGLRVRLLGGGPRRPGGLGGPVRRLLERRRDHRGQLPGGGRGQVGPDVRPRPAAAPRLRGPGPRALLGPHRAVPDPVRPGQPPGDRAHHRGPVLPPAAVPGPEVRPQAAGGVHPQVAAPGPPGPLADRGVHLRLVRRGARRPGRRGPRSSTPTRWTGWSCAPARWPTTPWPGGTSWARPAGAWPWSGSSSSTRGRRRPSRTSSRATPRPRRWCGCRRSPRTWGRGTSSTAASTSCCASSHVLRHVSRAESASPASGSAALHRLEQDDLLARAVG